MTRRGRENITEEKKLEIGKKAHQLMTDADFPISVTAVSRRLGFSRNTIYNYRNFYLKTLEEKSK